MTSSTLDFCIVYASGAATFTGRDQLFFGAMFFGNKRHTVNLDNQ